MSIDTFVFPTSFAQRRLWFVHQLEPSSPSYNVPTALWLSGSLDVAALEQALATIVARHEALRTTFKLVDGEPVQVVAPTLPVLLTVIDGSIVAAPDRELEVRRLIQEALRQPFDLEIGPLLRARLVRLAPDEHALILVVHHIVFDGWSAGVLSRELSECYRAFATGTPPQLPELSVQYSDYAVWQREWLSGEALERQLTYWRTQLAGAPTVLELPTDFPRPRTQSHRGATERIGLSGEVLEGLRALSQQEGATLFMTLLAGFQLLLSRYTGQNDIVVGSPIANRTRSELEHLIGFFVNSLPLRTNLSGDPSFRELLRRVREVALGAYAHQDLPFERMVEELQPERLGDRNPFFQVMFALQNAPQARVTLPGITLRSLPRGTGTAKFDLTLHMHQGSRGLTASLEYNTDLFQPATITRMLDHLRILLEKVAREPDRRLSAIPLLSEDERRRILIEWNQTERAFPADQRVQELFESQVARHGESIAVDDGIECLSYCELNRRANRVARYLRRWGVGPEVRVGVALKPSADLIVALLAVLKAGGAYVPLDLDYPTERLAFVLEDAGVSVLLSMASAFSRLPATVSRVGLDSDRDRIEAESNENLDDRSSSEHLAYIMYTSGSTGRPKGIEVPHRAITRLVRNTDYVQLTSEDRVAQISNPSFDATTFEIWGALLNGGRLELIPRDVVLSAEEFGAELRERGITALFLTTALFNQLSAAVPGVFETVRHLLFGGEAADPRQVRKVLAHRPPQRLLHVYGPTEVTTFAIWHEVREVAESAPTVPIGRPIANTTAYVLDQDMVPVAVGIPGELYLGGPGVARGYCGRPALTAERFVPDPFGPTRGSVTGGRLYRTGDRVRLCSDGSLEFLGRLDEQIKLRGFRIEPGEVEAALARHPAVRQCAVVVREDHPGGRALVAYLASQRHNGAGNQEPASLVPELRSYLQSRLPAYMVPSAFVVLDALPLSPNGKIARRELPAPTLVPGESQASFVPPRTSAEQILAGLWQNLLGINRVGIDDNFFEVGGHSLLAVRLFAEIEEQFGRKLPVSSLFQAPTVRRLAEILSQKPPSRWGDNLVVLQEGRRGPPLFVVHEVDGSLMTYRELVSRLGPDLPVYGFELVEERAKKPILTTFEELAAKYVEQMRLKQPTGPYFLCGYCWAGELTFEMARQLRALGQDVGLLALIDSRCRLVGPIPYHRRLSRVARKYWKLSTQNVRRLAALKPAAIPGFLRIRAENITMRLFGIKAYRWSLRLGRPVIPLLRDPSRSLAQAARSYRPSAYPGSITVFRACSPDAPHPTEGTLGWARVALGGVDVCEVPGEHLTIMHEPQVDELARNLRVRLDRARAGSS
jgi:amino acid adenylation domain-containing protein